MTLPSAGAPSAIGELHHDATGALEGWCCYPDQSGTRATIELLRDGAVVRTVCATRLRTDLRDRGLGDGQCGFWFPPPAGIAPDGPRTVLEVREQRLGTVFGRVIIGNRDPAKERRLEALALAQEAVSSMMGGLRQGTDMAAALGGLGQTLLHLAPRPPGRQTLGMPGLQACLQQISHVPPADLGWCGNPRLSVIVPAVGDVADLAARLRGAARVLGSMRAEFLLVDTGALPLALLLPTRLRGLVLVRARGGGEGPGGLLNAATARARGEILLFARPGGPGLADLDSANQLAPGAIGLDAALAPDLGSTGPMRHHQLHCAIRRADLAAMGGFDPIAEDDALWEELLAKAAALGLAVAPWRAPQPSRLPPALP